MTPATDPRPGDPLVVTLRGDGPGWRYCETLRALHFPKERNLVPAHVALFHHLPGEELEQVRATVREFSAGPFEARIIRVRSLGRGVAFVVEAPPLLALHRNLSTRWLPWLTPQDRGKFAPHITIQNKVEPRAARELLLTLESGFTPFSFQAIGLEIWHYRNGPWAPAAYHPFAL